MSMVAKGISAVQDSLRFRADTGMALARHRADVSNEDFRRQMMIDETEWKRSAQIEERDHKLSEAEARKKRLQGIDMPEWSIGAGKTAWDIMDLDPAVMQGLIMMSRREGEHKNEVIRQGGANLVISGENAANGNTDGASGPVTFPVQEGDVGAVGGSAIIGPPDPAPGDPKPKAEPRTPYVLGPREKAEISTAPTRPQAQGIVATRGGEEVGRIVPSAPSRAPTMQDDLNLPRGWKKVGNLYQGPDGSRHRFPPQPKEELAPHKQRMRDAIQVQPHPPSWAPKPNQVWK